MFLEISHATIITAALSIGWLVWKLWENNSPAKKLPGIPLVEFAENNSRQRYATEAGSLLGRGYETVRHRYSKSSIDGPAITDSSNST